MWLALPYDKQYLVASYLENVENEVNIKESYASSWAIIPRSPRGGGSGGGSSGGSSGSSGSSGGSRGGGSYGGGSFGGSSSGSGGSSGSSGGGSSGSRGGVSFGGGGRGASSWSGGGGNPATISSGAFAGRQIGGGSRGQVYGTSRYGSGYTYDGGGALVAGRSFPFGYWPVYVPVGAGIGYYGYHEYGPATNSSRPGGAMHQALIRHKDWPAEGGSSNASSPINNATASYYIVGDSDSVSAVMDALIKPCSVVRTSGTPINETNTTVHVEQAVQYYRASSFMLALTSYNNSANLPSSAPVDNNGTTPPLSADTPLPNGTDINFLKCLNDTIGASVPIMDAPESYLAITIAFSIFGGPIALAVLYICVRNSAVSAIRLEEDTTINEPDRPEILCSFPSQFAHFE